MNVSTIAAPTSSATEQAQRSGEKAQVERAPWGHGEGDRRPGQQQRRPFEVAVDESQRQLRPADVEIDGEPIDPGNEVHPGGGREHAEIGEQPAPRMPSRPAQRGHAGE